MRRAQTPTLAEKRNSAATTPPAPKETATSEFVPDTSAGRGKAPTTTAGLLSRTAFTAKFPRGPSGHPPTFERSAQQDRYKYPFPPGNVTAQNGAASSHRNEHHSSCG